MINQIIINYFYQLIAFIIYVVYSHFKRQKRWALLQYYSQQIVMYAYQQKSSLYQQNLKDLSLYFREIEFVGAKKVACIEIYQNWLYAGTKQYVAYCYQLYENPQSRMIELINERVFSAQYKSAKFIVASKQFLIIVPQQEQQLIRMWDRSTLQIVHGYQGHQKQISAVIFLNQARYIASCSEDGSVRVWKISDRIDDSIELSRYDGIFPVLTLAEMEGGNLAFAGDDSVITIWNWRENTVINKCLSHLGSTTSLSFCSPNFLFSTGGDSKLIIWQFTNNQKLRIVEKFRKKITQRLSVVQIGRDEILVIDASGRTYLLNSNLQLGCGHLNLKYTETIGNAKLWKDRLFAIIHNSLTGELKEIAVDLQQLREGSKPKLKVNPYNYSDHCMSISLTWKKLTLTDPLSGAIILKGLDGSFQSGNFVSIMGPSGAGKSSLLSLLTCRLRKNNTKLKIDGQLLLNGEEYTLQEFSKLAAYVQQDDVLFGALTVRQTFAFQAKLKLWSQSAQAQQKRCKEILQKLNLMDCADTMVGNSQFKKSISGGQKKRVAIGVELLSNPQILVFDEPTSGLDSHNALIITRLLGKLAKQQGKLVIATIHQPSTLIFREMGHLYLLNSGTRVYSGLANNIVPYMESIGITLNYRMNPADFFMLEISKLKQRSGYVTPLNSDTFQKTQHPPEAKVLNYSKEQLLNRCNLEEETPFSKQFWPLVQRGVKNFYRTPSNQINKPLTGILVPVFLGIMYLNIGNAPPQFSQSFLLNFFSYLFMGQYIVFSMNVYDMCLLFPTEKEIVCKEAGSNLYSLVVYFIAKFATEILGSVIPAITNGIIIYFMGGLDPTFEHFAIFIGLYIILSICGLLFGLMFGVLNKNAQKAVNLMPLVVIPLIMFGGLVVNINDIPVYVRWLSYLTPLRHSFIIIFKDQLLTSNLEIYRDLNLPAIYGLDGDPFVALACLLGLTGLYLIISVILLMLLKKKI